MLCATFYKECASTYRPGHLTCQSDEQASLMDVLANGSNLLNDDLDNHKDDDEYEDKE